MYRHCPIITACVGLFILLCGVICSLHIIPLIENHFFESPLGLRNGTLDYEHFRKSRWPGKFSVYLFHVRNPEEFCNGAKPVLKEMGPYVYDKYEYKEIISIDEESDTIEYLRKQLYHFNSSDSGCRTEEDEVIVINPILMAGCLEMKASDPQNMPLLGEMLPPEVNRVFLKVKVKDFLFSGIKFEIPENYTSICDFMSFMPKFLEIDENCTTFTFSMLNYINGTNLGPFKITRGITVGNKGSYVSYKMNKTNIWSGRYCNMINGTDLRLFDIKMFRHIPNRIYTFIASFCRSVFLVFEGEKTIFGVDTFKYSISKELLESSETTKCFCASIVGDSRPICPLSGTMNLVKCLNVNFLYSHPHFYLASPTLLNYANGLNPSKKLHSSFIHIEKHAPLAIHTQFRYQLNLEVKPFEGVDVLNNVREGIFPILWTQDQQRLPALYIAKFNNIYYNIFLLSIGKYCVITCGLLLMFSSALLLMARDKLICFEKHKKVNKESNTLLMVAMASGDQLKSTNDHCNLYPQLKNKNLYFGVIKRRNLKKVNNNRQN